MQMTKSRTLAPRTGGHFGIFDEVETVDYRDSLDGPSFFWIQHSATWSWLSDSESATPYISSASAKVSEALRDGIRMR
jgi:hypothetical protein